MSPLQITSFAPQHLPACAAIAAQAPDPWSRADLEHAEDGGHHRAFVALLNGSPVGFACYLLTPDSADLQMIAVEETLRRQGIARQLLSFSLARVAALGARRCLLEARASNSPALALYHALGFKTLATRPGMYAHPREDGLLLALPLTQEPTE